LSALRGDSLSAQLPWSVFFLHLLAERISLSQVQRKGLEGNAEFYLVERIERGFFCTLRLGAAFFAPFFPPTSPPAGYPVFFIFFLPGTETSLPKVLPRVPVSLLHLPPGPASASSFARVIFLAHVSLSHRLQDDKVGDGTER